MFGRMFLRTEHCLKQNITDMQKRLFDTLEQLTPEPPVFNTKKKERITIRRPRSGAETAEGSPVSLVSTSTTLPAVTSTSYAMPTAFAQGTVHFGSLFTAKRRSNSEALVDSKLEERILVDDTRAKLAYIGPVLFQTEYDVYAALMHMCATRQHNLNEPLQFKLSEFIELVNWTPDGRAYNKFKDFMRRLTLGQFSVTTYRLLHDGSNRRVEIANLTGLRLIKDFQQEKIGNYVQVSVNLDTRIAHLFTKSEYFLGNVSIRCKIDARNTLAKWLHEWILANRTDRETHPVSIQKIMESSGLMSPGDKKSNHRMEQQMRGALDELESCGFITGYKINKAKLTFTCDLNPIYLRHKPFLPAMIEGRSIDDDTERALKALLLEP